MLSSIFSQVISLTSVFSPWLLLAIFLIALASEFGIMIPFLMESVWLYSGYSVAIGIIAPSYLLLFCLVGLFGRQIGSAAVFHISWFASTPLGKLYYHKIQPKLTTILNKSSFFSRIIFLVKSLIRRYLIRNSELNSFEKIDSIKLFGRSFRLSPITVALGRFFWIRLPITIAMGATGQRTSLLWGVAIFSIIWDGAYIIFGILGGSGGLDPVQMVLYPLGAMVLISASVFVIRRWRYAIATR